MGWDTYGNIKIQVLQIAQDTNSAVNLELSQGYH